MQVRYNPTFKKKLKEISQAINVPESSIIKLMKHESGLDPSIKNSIGCVGLIQFCPGGGMPKIINGKSYTLDEIRYDLEAQMDAIKEFWTKGYNNGKIKRPADLYLYNFFPIAAGKPDDFVLATGITTTIRDFVKMSFAELGIELGFRGKNEAEEGYVVNSTGEFKLEDGKVIIKVDAKYYRPTEVDLLIGDASKAYEKLGWRPKYNLDALINEMVLQDLENEYKNGY